nr:MAG TPA: hypothetical protein [Caudoviricetes sp.]
MKLQKSTNIHIILLSAQSCFTYFMQYIKNSTFMNFLRRNAKATAKCSRPCENIIRSLSKCWSRYQAGTLSTCIAPYGA